MTTFPPLLRAGEGVLSPAALSRHAAAGLLQPVLPGVYLRADVAQDLQWRAAAVGAWRSDAVLCGAAAAALTFWRELSVTTIDVARETTVRRPGFRFLRRQIPPEHVIHRGELRLTAPALTALDLAVTSGPDAIDRALRSRMVRLTDLRSALTATPHRRDNVERPRLLLDSRDEPWSAAERLAHQLLRAARIVGWRANAEIGLRGNR